MSTSRRQLRSSGARSAVQRNEYDSISLKTHRIEPPLGSGPVWTIVLALLAGDLLREEVGRGIAPQNSPGVELGIVDSQRRAVPIARASQHLDAWPAVRQTWNHPDVLNGQTLQHPTRVNFAFAAMGRSIFEDRF